MGTQEYKIVEGTFYDRIDELNEMFYLHWEEVSNNKELMVIKGDKERYKQLDLSNNLLTLYLYENDILIGYSVNIITNHLHYADLICSMNDLLFVIPERRNSPAGLKLIRETEKRSKQRGAKMMFWHAKQDTPLYKILPALRHKVHEIIFSKNL